ncbi:(2Fe-2S)-binding protein [uncultured Imperialibacter sp.]|uniref:(2Fe-2S)-binding protein n=1 Tax=uncultured Imperialibacter sp. TaxID=1672639 RepID=UPI0030D79BB3|tara:strand:+ start:1369 stop:1833 length:465 start_codon:yes stop_codon:yes gene_type:complete
MPQFTLHINGSQKTVDTEPDTPLLYVLRDYLELNGPKFGCGLSQCGACMVLLDGRATTSCMIPVSAIGNTEITTLEGLADENGKLHVVQEAFVKEQAAQCGYCLNGMVISAVDLLNKDPQPDDAAIREALKLNLCRCGAHTRVIKAIKRAAKDS